MADATTRLVIEAQAKGLGEATKATAKLNESLGDIGKTASKGSRLLRDAFKDLSGQLRATTKDNEVLAAGFKVQSDAAQKLMTDYKNVTKQLAAMREEVAKLNQQARQGPIGVGGGGGGGGPIIGGGSGGGGGPFLPPPPIPGLTAPSRPDIPFVSGMAPIPGLTAPSAPIPPPMAGGMVIGDLRTPGARAASPMVGGMVIGQLRVPTTVPVNRTNREALLQGLLQGSIGESFIGRGPGALAQGAGIMAGRAVMDVLSAGKDLLMSPLTGSSAAIAAASKIPFTDGRIAAQLQATLNAAQSEVSTRSSFQSLLPFIRGASDPGALLSLNTLRNRTSGLGIVYGGMSGNQAAATIAQMAASGGGYASQYSSNTLKEAFAANAGLGIDAGTSGVLARGDRLGATTGATSTLSKSIADAISLGLQGSEIVKYVQSIAGSVESFAQTGIKVDPSSRGSLGRFLEASGGYSAPRAAALATSLSSSLDDLADSGPQNANQMLVLQAAGYNPADPDSYYRAQERLDNASPGERAKIYASAQSTALRGYGGLSRYGKAAAFRAFSEDNKMNLRIGESLRATRGGKSGALQAALTPTSTSAAMQKVEAMGQFNTFTSTQMAGEMANQEMLAGQGSVNPMMEMDLTAKRALNSLGSASAKLMDFARATQEVASNLANLSDGPTQIATPASVR